VCLAFVVLFSVAAFAPNPAAAALPIPLRTEGRALSEAGSPLPIDTPIRTFLDGVDYSNESRVQDGAGSFVVLTRGNSKADPNVSDTPSVLEGPNIGDVVIYATGDFTSFTRVFIETGSWSPAGIVRRDLTLGLEASTPQPVKIQGLVTQPARGGNQFVFLCNPTPSVVFLGDYYLERNAPNSYRGPRFDLTGNLAPASILQVILASPTWLTAAGDALKLVYRNPASSNAPAAGGDIVVDRVEYNATQNGALTWEPANTILGDAVAPGPGQVLQRNSACTDTNRPVDFSLVNEPGLPDSNDPPSVTIVTPGSGQTVPGGTTVTFTWTLSDDVFVQEYLQVWANVTSGNQTIPLVDGTFGTTSATWMAPDETLSGLVLRVEVQDPFGARGTATQTFSVTRQSPLALVVAILIAIVIIAFVIFGFLRARKPERRPPPAPPTPPMMPASPPTAAIARESGVSPVGQKTCPRCHTLVNAADVTCFFCGYHFAEETKGPP
jgi:hypothetical protein